MMLVLFDNTTSSDDSMDAVGEMRKIANEQCFISGMTGVVQISRTGTERTSDLCCDCCSTFKSDCSELTCNGFIGSSDCSFCMSDLRFSIILEVIFSWTDFLYHESTDSSTAARCYDGLFHFPAEQL